MQWTISFEGPVAAKESKFGTAQPVNWVRLITCKAAKQDATPSRSDAVRLGLEVGRNQVRFRFRYRADITADMRLVLHGDSDVVYQIVGGPAEIGDRRKDELEIVCERYTS